jgi:uncharacterized protein (TIGR00369 family)
MSKAQPTAADLIRAFVEHSPFARVLKLEVDDIEPDRAELSLPFDESVATYGDVVHGGALASLIDVAATAAAWSAAEFSETPRGATVSMTVDYLRAARGKRLTASARVTRRGSSLCFCDVDVHDSDGELVAKGLVTYKIG